MYIEFSQVALNFLLRKIIAFDYNEILLISTFEF